MSLSCPMRRSWRNSIARNFSDGDKAILTQIARVDGVVQVNIIAVVSTREALKTDDAGLLLGSALPSGLSVSKKNGTYRSRNDRDNKPHLRGSCDQTPYAFPPQSPAVG